jgi:hypothetical protein
MLSAHPVQPAPEARARSPSPSDIEQGRFTSPPAHDIPEETNRRKFKI